MNLSKLKCDLISKGLYTSVLMFSLTLYILVLSTPSNAQSKDSLFKVSVSGKVKDSVYNFVLTSATVAVYTDDDSSLLQFSLPNTFGEFKIQSLPSDIPLRLVISHIGYTTLLKKFSLRKDQKQVDFGLLYMHQNTDKDGNMLDEVVVKAIPPMRMNGDTVEFNADAFRMNANSTAEDLMRRLPGFTIWGDGEITYNGKKINAVLVEGKPFMGSSDPTVATQNLPKDALDKIQVYQQKDEKNPLDSTLFANIKLKEDKKLGYFGKLSAGYGTDSRYAVDGMLSGFNKKIQVNVVGALNNINKVANNIDVLMKNSSFKGEGNNIDYQSNFNMRGLNRPSAAGIKFQYDFIPDVQYRRNSRLNVDYFLNDNNVEMSTNSLVNSYLEADTILSRKSRASSLNQSTDQKINSRYSWDSEYASLTISSSLTNTQDKIISEVVSEQEKTGVGDISSNFTRNSSESLSRIFSSGVQYLNRDVQNRKQLRRIPKEFSLGYNLTVYDNDGRRANQTSYLSEVNKNDNRVYDRIYDKQDAHGNSHQITFQYPGLTKLLFNRRTFGGVQMAISGSFIFQNDNNINRVLDRDTLSQYYLVNTYLSNVSDAVTSNFQPAFNISKSFYKGLTNRYNKWVAIQLNLKNQYFSFDHRATQSFQNFKYSYRFFIPDALLEYNNHQYGNYESKYSINFLTSVTYPGLNNIAPLVDSSNVWYVPKGNPFIRPQYRKDLNFAYTFTTRTSKSPLSVNFRLEFGQIDNNITDSSIFDNAGVRTVYAVNMDGNRFINGESGVKKSFELRKNTTVEANGRYRINIGQNPQYINSLTNISKSENHNILLNLGFRLKELLNLKAEQNFGIYKSKQEGFNNNQFKSINTYTRFIGTLQFPQKISWSTNITFNQSKNNNTTPIHFSIWNASLAYRFLKAGNGEIKFAALDLLRQNKGIVNTSTANTQTFVTTNVLQQYYLLTFSYYPRKFGSKTKNEE